uniref:Caspase family p20 domain-containing protein n=1 Tax=Clastoptera arizonana TaxID=38151 RepID=A0A1B6D4Z5_9HEMI
MCEPFSVESNDNELNDNNYNLRINSEVGNVNSRATIASIEELTEEVAVIELITKYQTANMYFEEYDGDDEVFEEYEEPKKSITVRAGREPRVRRISDVIDSIGETSPSPSTKDRSHSFTFPDQHFAQTEAKSVMIVRREEVSHHFHLEGPPKSKQVTAMDSPGFPMTPPMTPSSDVGYYSTGQQPSTPSMMVFRPKWFRYSNSSMDAMSPPKLDTLDAKSFQNPIQPQEPVEMPEPKPQKSSNAEASMPVEKDAVNYNMDHPKRGHAIIFNHEEFTMDNMPARRGSHLDAARLQNTLTALGFSVQVFNDLCLEKIKSIIANLANLDHSDCDCVMVVVLSHGLGTDYLLSYDYPYPVDMLWTPFTPDKCASLAGKPKLFVIQACRGEKLDSGVRLVRTQTDSGGNNYKIPGMTDFLIAYSTVEGFYSWRNPQNGTWFIQSLCEILESEGTTENLATLLLKVSRKVALDFESYNDLIPWQHQQKQVPQIVSTLIRHVYFNAKP